MLPVLFITTFFVFLTQHPFPDPQTLVCPVPLTDPQWQPFHFAKRIQTLMQAGAGPLQFLTNKGLAATAMNFLICFAIGAALARHAPSMRHAMLFAAALTLGVELTQMTGFWGVYPCAYRQFDVDDLMLNFAGVVMGTALGLASHRLR
jgi:glycopeptide antibiotics resistance protein